MSEGTAEPAANLLRICFSTREWHICVARCNTRPPLGIQHRQCVARRGAHSSVLANLLVLLLQAGTFFWSKLAFCRGGGQEDCIRSTNACALGLMAAPTAATHLVGSRAPGGEWRDMWAKRPCTCCSPDLQICSREGTRTALMGNRCGLGGRACGRGGASANGGVRDGGDKEPRTGRKCQASTCQERLQAACRQAARLTAASLKLRLSAGTHACGLIRLAERLQAWRPEGSAHTHLLAGALVVRSCPT